MADMDTNAIAQALKDLDWTSVPVRNREAIEQAIAALEHGDLNAAPIPMLLFCPACGLQHVDAPEPARDGEKAWDNPPHRSHKCHACATVWRPADVPTVGVASIQTSGQADNWDRSASAAAFDAAGAAPVGMPTPIWWIDHGTHGHITMRADEAESARNVGATVHQYHAGRVAVAQAVATLTDKQAHALYESAVRTMELGGPYRTVEAASAAIVRALLGSLPIEKIGAVRTVTIEEVEKSLLRKLLSFAREIDIKWHRDRNEICRIKLDVRDGESMAPRLIEHRADLIREFVSTARNAFSADGGAGGALVTPDQTTEAAR